jgi:FAD:protein FMN transferase
MNSCSNAEIRRCRPLLGTFVEIRASGSGETELHKVVEAAFAAVERIQGLMSAHDPDSELSRLNRESAHRPVTVSGETFSVLRRAHALASESGGAFDYTIAPALARWGMLPANLSRDNPGGWRDVRLLRQRKVRFLRPLALDLGGIAKGFAVDKALEVLRVGGVRTALVSAGGDLRVFGPQRFTVHLRHPGRPQSFVRTIELSGSALATSSPCFTERRWRGQRVSQLVDPLRRTAITGGVSVSVRAGQCWLADALTKVVLNAAPALAEQLLARHKAEAFVFTA